MPLKPDPQPAPSAPPETIDLQQWLLDNGASFPKICISAVVKDHRKISAVVPLQAHKEIICIPLRCCISYQTAVQLPLARHVLKDPAFDKVLSQDMAGCRSTDLLVLYLLLDGSDTNSFHVPYYRSLPLHTANFPACWSEQELACLEGSRPSSGGKLRHAGHVREACRGRTGDDDPRWQQQWWWC